MCATCCILTSLDSWSKGLLKHVAALFSVEQKTALLGTTLARGSNLHLNLSADEEKVLEKCLC